MGLRQELWEWRGGDEILRRKIGGLGATYGKEGNLRRVEGLGEVLTAELLPQGSHTSLLGENVELLEEDRILGHRRAVLEKLLDGGQRQSFKEMQFLLLENNSQELYKAHVRAYVITI